MEKERKYRVAITAGTMDPAMIQNHWRELSENRLVLSTAVTVFPAGEEGLKALVEAVKTTIFDVLIVMPFPGMDLKHYLREHLAADDSYTVKIRGEIKAIKLLPDNSNDPAFLPEAEEIAQKIKDFAELLKQDFCNPLPRIAVFSTSNNVDGKLSKEDKEKLIPAIRKAFDAKIPVFGPFSIEKFFEAHNENRFNGLVFMGGDQAKYIRSDYSNFMARYEANLPFILIYPDPCSEEDTLAACSECVFYAKDILNHRADFAELNKNPLKFELKRENNEHQAF